ncbi:MAG: hypothetical protein ACRDRK_25550 [Pseudonocardia sp.]
MPEEFAEEKPGHTFRVEWFGPQRPVGGTVFVKADPATEAPAGLGEAEPQPN